MPSLHIFRPAARYPADPRVVFMFALTIFTCATSLVLEIAPPTINNALPWWAVVLWSTLLGLGSVVTLVGMAIQSLNGIIIEQIGSVAVAATTLFYAAVAFGQIGTDAIIPVGLVISWGLACSLRWVQLQLLIGSAYLEMREKTGGE